MKEVATLPIVPEKFSSHSLSISNVRELSSENTFDMQNDYFDNREDVHPYIQSHVSFEQSSLVLFTSSEAKLCSHILKAITKGENSIFIPLPSYAQDTFFTKTIAGYLDFSKSKSIIVDAKQLDAVGIINEITNQLGIKNSNHQFYEFAHLMTNFFEQGHILHIIIQNTDNLTTQDYGYLYELATIIFEKFPRQKDKTLIKYIFIGDASVEKILRKKVIGNLKKIEMYHMTVTDCVNALYLYTPQSDRGELFYQTISNDAYALWIASCGYPALLRHLLPFPSASSLADRQQPENYLCKIIDNKIDIKHHKSLAYRRAVMTKGHHILKDIPNMKIVFSVGAFALFSLSFYLFFMM